MLLRGSDDRAPGTVGGPITTESPVIAGNRIQPETSEASVYADCQDDCHAEGRGFESHQPLSKDPANRGLVVPGRASVPHVLQTACHSCGKPWTKNRPTFVKPLR